MPRRAVLLASFYLLSFALPAVAQVGAPLVGLEANVTANNLFLEWLGTDDDEGHASELLMLGGFSVLGALTPGGSVIGSLQVPVLPTGPENPFVPSTVIPGRRMAPSRSSPSRA